VRWTIIITMLLALATGTARAEPAADTGDPAAAGTATTTEGADAPEAETEGETGKVDEELDVLESDKEITVTATRTERDTFELPHAVFIATREEVDDVGRIVGLKTISRRDPAVWYDERTYSTTDPIIRGFAGFNLLTLVDGNTLSTLWGEGGFGSDDMYGKIDPDTIERVEVVFGPNSVLYGSNALGAVINVITRDSPIDFTGGGWQFGGRIKGDWGSAASGYAARGEVFGASPDLKFLIGGSYRDFQDVRGGRGLGILDPTEFEDLNWDIATTWKITDGRELRATYQHVERDPTFRYYRPHQDNRNDRRALAFTYRDTARDMPWDSLEARLYWQLKKDRRGFYTDATRTELQRTGEATTETWAAGLTATKDVGGGHVLTGGLAFELTMGDSPDDEQFTYIWPGPKRRDAPLSDWYDFGVFLQDEWTIVDDVTVTGSIRYDYFIFETDVDEYYVPPVGDPEDDEYRDTQGAFTGGLGVVYRATPEIRLFGSWARGFRQGAPNFGLRQLGDGVLVPNQLLNPTTSDNFEIGVKGRYEGFTFEAIGYYSLIQNWQGDLRPTTWERPGLVRLQRQRRARRQRGHRQAGRGRRRLGRRHRAAGLPATHTTSGTRSRGTGCSGAASAGTRAASTRRASTRSRSRSGTPSRCAACSACAGTTSRRRRPASTWRSSRTWSRGSTRSRATASRRTWPGARIRRTAARRCCGPSAGRRATRSSTSTPA
jgi:hemoglobin/transferrin/lactoferrin receptor protein